MSKKIDETTEKIATTTEEINKNVYKILKSLELKYKVKDLNEMILKKTRIENGISELKKIENESIFEKYNNLCNDIQSLVDESGNLNFTKYNKLIVSSLELKNELDKIKTGE